MDEVGLKIWDTAPIRTVKLLFTSHIVQKPNTPKFPFDWEETVVLA